MRFENIPSINKDTADKDTINSMRNDSKMDKVCNNLKLTDFCSITQMKRKFKSYLEEINYKEFKLNNFPHCLVVSLVILVEECISDCLKYVIKNEVNGLYTINQQVLKLMFNETNKYDFFIKYTKKYSQGCRICKLLLSQGTK